MVTQPDKVRLLLVDDHILFRQGLASLFTRQPDFELAGEAGSVQEAICKALELKPDLVLMDFNLPDGSGVEATQAILAKLPESKIVFLTMHEEDDRLFEALRSGAKGYLLKNVPVSELMQSLRGLVQQNSAPLSPQMTTRLIQEFARTGTTNQLVGSGLETLTSREREVLRELARGTTNREIARCLFISEFTVKNHIHNIYKKLNLKNRREATQLAARLRLS